MTREKQYKSDIHGDKFKMHQMIHNVIDHAHEEKNKRDPTIHLSLSDHGHLSSLTFFVLLCDSSNKFPRQYSHMFST